MVILEFILNQRSEIKASERQVVEQEHSRKTTVFPNPVVIE